MRRATLFLLALTAAVATIPPAEGETPSEARCRFSAGSELNPGLSVRPGSGEFWTNGDTGLLECVGIVAGHRTTGTGTMGFQGRYGVEGAGDSCLTGGKGSGLHLLYIPTEVGTVQVVNPFEFTYGAIHLEGPMGGTFHGPRMSGRFDVTAQTGDCVKDPVTLVRIDGEGILRT
jgi:hypothetical protein